MMTDTLGIAENRTLLFEGTQSAVYYQEGGEFAQPVIIKVLQPEAPTAAQITAFFNEFEISQSLNVAGIRRAIRKTNLNGKPAIIMEYIAGESLRDRYAHSTMPLGLFFDFADKVCQILGEIHSQNVIHKDINTRNILLTDENEVRIIDFGISSRINLKTQNLGNPEKLEGTLAYISPEQTGRMNRVVDYRTDLYSLGVVFYELLTGRLPFENAEALALVHAHLAQSPEHPHILNSQVPVVIGDIILKLLRKNAEDRYQSAFGLQYDLVECRKQWEQKGKITPFTLGAEDFSGKLQIPQHLYGREPELHKLMEAYNRTCMGTTELLLIEGYSGVGKSALVHEIHKPVTERRGFFVEGKFDQFQRNIPYYAWIQAFKEFIGLLLTESVDKLADWRKKILQAVGNNGKVLTDVIPNLELVIGEQPEVADLGASEAEKRFHFLIQNFVNAISRQEHPLVIFIDDWQWADSASMDLLKVILTNCNEDYLLIIGAYRENEVSASHPFRLMLDEIREEEIHIEVITLGNLTHADVESMMADALLLPKDALQEFDDLIYEKTQGNAFFVNQMLRSLYEENVLKFDFTQRRWTWDINQIKALGISENVADLLAVKVQKLPKDTQNTLKIASGVGNRFTADILAMVEETEHTADSTLTQRLERAMVEGFIIPTDNDYRFAHDRIQQAIYSLIPEAERQAIHLRIGRLLTKHIGEDRLDIFIFDIVNQWNLGRSLVTDATERRFLIELNLAAGTKARDSAAYEPALAYLQTAIELLPAESWDTDYNLTLQLYSKALEVAFLNGDLDLTRQYNALVIQYARTTLDKMPAFELEMQYHIAQGDQQKAITTGLHVLELLNIPLANTPQSNLNVDVLYTLPVMQDAEKQAAMEIMDSIITPAWVTQPDLFRQITYTMVNLSVEYGNCPSSCVGYVFYGSLLCSELGDIELGYNFGKLGVRLLATFDAKFFRAKVDNIFISNVMHWKEPARATRKPHFDAIQIGLETGEIEFASYNVVEACHYQFLMGIGLDNLKLKFEKDRALVEQLKQEFHEYYLAPWQQMVQNLMSESPNGVLLQGEFFDETALLPNFIAENQLTLAFVVYQAKVMLAYWLGDYERAYQDVLEADKYKEGVLGMLHQPTHTFFEALVLIALFPKVSREQKEQFLRKIQENQHALKNWASHSPANYQHKYQLLAAETMRLSGQTLKAMDYYEAAIENAKKNRFLHEEALANELAGRFFQEQDKEKIARTYIQEAYHKYQLWGAKRKLEHLEAQYDKYLKGISNPFFVSPNLKATTLGTSTSSLFSLDINTIVKASQTLSGEVVLSNLLRKMMRLVIENAGAEKGLFLLPKDNGWYIEAESSIHSQEVAAMQSLPIESYNGFADNPKLSTEVVYYVLRTRETLVIADASNENRVIGKTYVQKVQPKSVLCMPLLYQGKLSGILYLENNLTTDAFTPSRLEVLEMLSTQITISVQNALLYENLEEKVRERTAEVIAQKEIIEKKTQDMVASINYAKRIQDASLPRLEYIREWLPKSFVFFRPRDIVSGDFYWASKTMVETPTGEEVEKIIITAVDCTGHGVPGAFMSMIGTKILNEIIEIKGITEANLILNELHKGVRAALRQAETENRDGMDMALCVIDNANHVVEFAGAKNPLIYIQNGVLMEIKADKMPIGGKQKEEERLFTKHLIKLTDEAGERIPTHFYMFSDGYPDQFGGPNGQKFMVKKLKSLILDIHQQSHSSQHEILEKTFITWQGEEKQLDDVLVMGFEL